MWYSMMFLITLILWRSKTFGQKPIKNFMISFLDMERPYLLCKMNIYEKAKFYGSSFFSPFFNKNIISLDYEQWVF